ncbi:MAG: hypothetical protein HY259_10340 [Chloroflexi bacterium]|nr:hypothetical protein [Chloroflexota bacterium]MBI3733836.1 hypothetical protein [Chloroflexota bacterium]
METKTKTDVGMAPMTASKPTGEAAAAILAAGIGSFGYGLTVTLTEAIPNLKTFMGGFNAGVGPLAGKTGTGMVIWLAAWVVLHFMWKDKDVKFDPIFIWTLILIIGGLLGTFPIFYDLFAPK